METDLATITANRDEIYSTYQFNLKELDAADARYSELDSKYIQLQSSYDDVYSKFSTLTIEVGTVFLPQLQGGYLFFCQGVPLLSLFLCCAAGQAVQGRPAGTGPRGAQGRNDQSGRPHCSLPGRNHAADPEHPRHQGLGH